MKIKKIKNKHEEGFVLVVSLLVLAVSIAIGGGTVYNATKQVVQSKNWERSQQALYAAEAGVESAKKWLQTQYDDKRIPVASGQKTKIDCYENFTVKEPDIVKAEGASPDMGEVDAKDFLDGICIVITYLRLMLLVVKQDFHQVLIYLLQAIIKPAE